MSTTVSAIVGLGTPGKDYARTRHNAGFWFLDALADDWRVSFNNESRFKGEVASKGSGDERLILLKPMTWMNNSGEAVQALAAFHKIEPTQILVVHDELDLPVGAARLKAGGGHGGHNGLRSIHQHLGPDYLRLRLGVGHPGSKERVHAYLTDERTPAAEEALIKDAISASLKALPLLLSGSIEKAMQSLHTASSVSSPNS